MKRIITFVWIMLVLTSSGGHTVSGLQPSLLTNFTRVRGLALHPDGQTLAIGGRYNDQPGVWFYDLTTENVTGIPTGGNVSSLFWRPDSSIIAAGVSVGEGRTVQVFDEINNTLLFEFDSESSRKQVLWSSDGSQFMTPASYRAFRRDGNTGAVLQTFTFPDTNRRTLTGIAWAETHQRLYGALDVDRELLVWDTTSGALLPSIELPFVSWGPQINHAGDLMAIGSDQGDGRVLVLDVVTGAVILDFVTEGGGFIGSGPIWSPDDSKLAIRSSTNQPNPIWIWDVETGALVNSIPVQQSAGSEAMVWSDDSESLIFSDGEVFPIWVTPPTANGGVDQTVSAVNEVSAQVTLDGSGSVDADGEIVSYQWIENGVEIATGVNPTVTLPVGVHTVTLIVTDDGGATGLDEVIITVTVAPTPIPPTPVPTTEVPPTPEPVALYRVNTGSAVDLTVNGVLWEKDDEEKYYDGGVLNDFSLPPYTPVAIDNTEDDALYQSEHSGEPNNRSFTYNFPVTNGTYTVKLHFAEIWFTDLPNREAAGVGQRVFDVLIENALVLDEYDVTAAAGAPLRAQVETFADVSVTDGYLTIYFPQASVDNPTIEAIEIWTTVGGGGAPSPTPTHTYTPVPPTDTPVPATDTPIPPTATFTPTNVPITWQNEIAFSSNRNLPGGTNTGYNVYRASKDDPAATVLTTLGASVDNTPVWSPDRGWIVYVRDNDLWVLHVASLTTQALTVLNTSDQEINPAWSPDGDQIAFGSNRDGNQDIYTATLTLTYTGSSITVSAGTPQNLTPTGTFDDRYPVWSPVTTAGAANYNRIAFRTDRGAGGNNEIYTILADDNTESTLLAVTSTAAGVNNTQPEWAPSGFWLAFASNINDANLDIYAVRYDATNGWLTTWRRLTNTPNVDDNILSWRGIDGVWYIAYTRIPASGNYDIRILEVEKNPVSVVGTLIPDWNSTADDTSPDW